MAHAEEAVVIRYGLGDGLAGVCVVDDLADIGAFRDVGRCGITLPGSLRRLVVTEERAGTNGRADGIFVLIEVVAGGCMAYSHSSSSSSGSMWV